MIPPPDGVRRFREVTSVLPRLYSSLKLLPRAIDLSSQMRIGVYDCLYVALAEQEHCDLVTADSRLVHSMPGFPIVSLDAVQPPQGLPEEKPAATGQFTQASDESWLKKSQLPIAA